MEIGELECLGFFKGLNEEVTDFNNGSEWKRRMMMKQEGCGYKKRAEWNEYGIGLHSRLQMQQGLYVKI